MNVLILTGKFGMGHYAASRSLYQQIRDRFDNATIEVEDLFEYALPECAGVLYGSFHFLVSRASFCYNALYRCTENRQDIRPMFLHYFMAKLDELIARTHPNAIISTLPVCSQLVSRYKGEYGCDIPLITCMTDISSHAEWINKHTDYYLVGSPSLRMWLMQKGVEPEKIFVSGIPVRAEFHRAPRAREDNRRELLLMGGGLGLLPHDESFYEALHALPGVHTTLIAGKNHRLQEKLQGRWKHIEVLGYTEKVYEYMQRADLVLSKPGGITLFESIYSETPMLCFEPYLHQEADNAEFIRSTGIGIILDKKEEAGCVAQIAALLQDGESLERMRGNIRELKRQLDDAVIERLLLALQPQRMEAIA